MNNNTNDEWLNLTTTFTNNDTLVVVVNNATSTLNNNITTTATSDPMSTALWCLAWMGLCMYACCTRQQGPSREHWRGEEIRERAQRTWRRQERLSAKQLPTSNQRQSLVLANLRTKRILSQDSQGNWTLGNLTSGGSLQNTKAPDEDDDEEAQVCMICLEPFQVGDVVSWSRYSETCHHVFHSECIQPWLQDKRQDECPSCRSNLIVKDNSTIDTPEDEENDEENPKVIDNCREEESEEEEDSLFVIMHGLISRAAHRATYTLIGTQDAFDNIEHNHNNMKEETTSLSVPTPLRRVVNDGTTMNHHRQSPPASSLDPQSLLSQPIEFRRSVSDPPSLLSRPIALRRSISGPPTLRRRSSRIGYPQEPSESSMEDVDLAWLVPPSQVIDQKQEHPASGCSSSMSTSINRLDDTTEFLSKRSMSI